MATAADIKRRISSVKNTAQITKAMEMVSASKMQRAQDRALMAIPYAEGLYEIVAKLGKVDDYDSVYLRSDNYVNKIAIVVVGTSRGFVGGMITNLTTKTYQLKQDLIKKYPQAEITGISIHKTAQKVLANAGIKNDYHFSEYFEAPTTTELTPVFDILVEKFAAREYDEIHIVYTHFENTMLQRAKIKKLLPLDVDIIQEKGDIEESEADEEELNFKFEPSTEAILDRLLPEYFQTQIFTSVLESIASEHSARMVAMKSATDNANELTKKLNRKYNKTRQAAITQQIIEVINGAG